jgi:hypothetical protein
VNLPLPLPQLDDRAWPDLIDEGRALIPAWAPEWTNHNPSDPGITLMELFAYLSEMLIYRLNRVSDDNVISFLKLLNGPGWQAPAAEDSEAIDRARQSTLLAIGRSERAVSARDFEELTLSVNNTLKEGDARIARVSCIQGHNLPAEWEGASEEDTSADVSVVVLTDKGSEPPPELLHKVKHILDDARLLATRVHVLGPRLVNLNIRATLGIRKRFHAEPVRKAAQLALERFFDPLHGGPDGGGWPFGRDVYLSEIYQLLAGIDGVTEVSEVAIFPAEKTRLIKNRLHEVESIDIQQGELVKLQIAPENISVRASER